MTLTTEIHRVFELLMALAWRDVRVRYKQSLLGIAWAVMLPLLMMLLFTFVFTRAVGGTWLAGLRLPYALYAFAGLVPWMFFSNSLSGCVNSLVANRNLVTKVYFPREVFPLSAVAAAFVDFAVAMMVLWGLIGYFHLRGEFTFVPTIALLAVLALTVIQIALTIGLGLILAMANLFYRDVRLVASAMIQLWMFISAVVVPVPHDASWTARFIALNPMVPLMEGYREAILYGQMPATGGVLYAATVGAVLLIGGWAWFRRASYRFAEEI